MKKLFLAIFLLILGLTAFGQFQQLGSPIGNNIAGVNAQKYFRLPNVTFPTLNGRVDSLGCLVYNKTDSSVYQYDGNGLWRKIGTGGGSSGGGGDTIINNTTLNTYQYITYIVDSTVNTSAVQGIHSVLRTDPNIPSNDSFKIAYPARLSFMGSATTSNNNSIIGVYANPNYNSVVLANKVGVGLVRGETVVTTSTHWPFQAYMSAGKDVFLTVNYFPTNQPFVTPAQLSTATAALRAYIHNKIKGYANKISFDNEENSAIRTGAIAADYINWLQAATQAAHDSGMTATNGGLTGKYFKRWVWKWLANQPSRSADAAAFAAAEFRPSEVAGLANWDINPSFSYFTKLTDTLIAAYASIPIDWVNFHWYEPDNDTTVHTIDTRFIGFAVEALQAVTGKIAITNELGQHNSWATIPTQLLTKLVSLNMPYIIWYSGDGQGDFHLAYALSDSAVELRPNGYDFKQFKGNYVALDTTSKEFMAFQNQDVYFPKDVKSFRQQAFREAFTGKLYWDTTTNGGGAGIYFPAPYKYKAVARVDSITYTGAIAQTVTAVIHNGVWLDRITTGTPSNNQVKVNSTTGGFKFGLYLDIGDDAEIVFTPIGTSPPASSITGLISAGTNVTITGTGTSGSPYVINSSGGGGSAIYHLPYNGSALSYLGGDSALHALSGVNVSTLINDANYINQAGARTAISLTTTGTGAATYNNSTGVLNVPTPSASGTVTSFSKTDGYAITSSVANSTTTPNHTIAVDSATLASYFPRRKDSTLTFATPTQINSLLGGYVPTSRTVAGFALSGNVTLATLSNGYGINSISYNGSSTASVVLDSATLFTSAVRRKDSTITFVTPTQLAGFGYITSASISGKEDVSNKTATQSSSASTYPNWLGVTNYVGTLSGVYQPLENQRLSTSNTPTFAGLTSNGIVKLIGLAGTPTAPASGTQNVYADSTGAFTMQGSNGFAFSISKARLTANRRVYAQDKNYTFGDSADIAANTAAINGKLSSLAITAVKTSNYTAAVNDFVLVNTTSGVITITLPTAPADKSVVAVKHVIQGSSNPVVITAGGSDVIEKSGGPTSTYLETVYQTTYLQYISGVWYSLFNFVNVTTLDSRYLTASTFNTSFDARFGTKTTSNLAEGTGLYYSNARGIGSTLTGYTSGAGTISSADNILQAIQKLNGNVALKGDAVTANPLSQFAATTSAQLRSVLSDESGTGNAYFQGGDLGTPSAGVLTNVTGLPLTSAVTGILPVANGGTGLNSITASYIPYGTGTTAMGLNNGLLFDATNVRLGVNTAGVAPSTTLEIVGDNPFLATAYGSSNNAGLVGRKANGTAGSPTQVTTDQFLAFVAGRGYHNGGAFSAFNSALIGFRAAENFTSTANGAYLTFETTPTGSTTRAEAMRINANKTVAIGGTGVTYTLDVTGTFNVSGAANFGTNIGVTSGIDIGTAGAGLGTVFANVFKGKTGATVSVASVSTATVVSILQGASEQARWAASTGNLLLKTTTDVPSSMVTMASTSQGFLPPRMTKTQRDAISSPATGLVIWQTDNTPGLRSYNGTNWMKYTETTD